MHDRLAFDFENDVKCQSGHDQTNPGRGYDHVGHHSPFYLRPTSHLTGRQKMFNE